MAQNYKRTIIQIPLEDLPAFEEYANKYSLSLSGTIVFLAKKSLEQEEVVKQLPFIIDYMTKEQKKNSKKSSARKKK